MESWTDQRLERRDALLKEILVVLERILEVLVERLRDLNASIKTIKDNHLREPTQREEDLELFHDNDSLSKIGVQDLIILHSKGV